MSRLWKVSRLQTDRHTYTQTDSTERITCQCRVQWRLLR